MTLTVTIIINTQAVLELVVIMFKKNVIIRLVRYGIDGMVVVWI